MLSHSSGSCCRTNQTGQIGVIILLIMAVLLTTGLSLAVRTTQELYLAKQTEDTTRVFNAAEAGVEEALSDVENSTGGSFTFDNAQVDYSVNALNNLTTKLYEGMTAMVKLPGGASNSSITLQWARESACSDQASLMISIYSFNGTTTSVRHRALQGCATHSGGGFEAVGGGVVSSSCANGFNRCATITGLLPEDEFVRIKPLYNDTDISVTGVNLPTQAYGVRSQAKNTQGNETRIVEVTQTLPAAPSIMDYALVSGTDLVK